MPWEVCFFHSSDGGVLPSGPLWENRTIPVKWDTHAHIFCVFFGRFLLDLPHTDVRILEIWSGICAIELYFKWYYIVKINWSVRPTGLQTSPALVAPFSTHDSIIVYKMRENNIWYTSQPFLLHGWSKVRCHRCSLVKRTQKCSPWFGRPSQKAPYLSKEQAENVSPTGFSWPRLVLSCAMSIN